MSFKAKYQKINRREWHDIRTLWLNHLPSFSGAASPPTASLSQLIALTGKLDTIDQQNEVLREVGSLRQIALWESIFLLHKGGSIMRSAQRAASAGMKSWSVFSGYHSAYMSARATMGLLGVAVPQPAGQQLLLELFPTIVGMKPKSRRRLNLDDDAALAYKLGQLQQNHLWQLFVRTISVSTVSVWDQNIVESLKSIGPENFSTKRNAFIYDPVYWPFDDLVTNSIDGSFCAPPQDFPNNLGQIDPQDPETSLIIALLIFRLGHSLVADLAEIAPILNDELSVYSLEDWRNDSSLYQSYFP